MGLAYLLQGKEAEAQTAWFYILTQENEQYLQELTNILGLINLEILMTQTFLVENLDKYNLKQLLEILLAGGLWDELEYKLHHHKKLPKSLSIIICF